MSAPAPAPVGRSLPDLPPIRYINLDRDAARRAAMEDEFARLGLSAERCAAVLWTALAPAQQEALYSPALNARQHHLPLANGEKGCYASHLALWRWLLASPHECLVVLEDDVQLLDDFAPVVRAVAALRTPWDMVKLIGRNGLGKPEKPAALGPLSATHQWLRYRRVPSLTAGYMLHRRGAAKLLAHRLPFGRPIDVDLRHWWECDRMQVLGVQPAVIALSETSLQSSVQADLKRLRPLQRWRKFLLKARYSIANAWHQARTSA